MMQAMKNFLKNLDSVKADDPLGNVDEDEINLSDLHFSNNFGVDVSEANFADFDRRKEPRLTAAMVLRNFV